VRNAWLTVLAFYKNEAKKRYPQFEKGNCVLTLNGKNRQHGILIFNGDDGNGNVETGHALSLRCRWWLGGNTITKSPQWDYLIFVLLY
jgi:hypothetical protein